MVTGSSRIMQERLLDIGQWLKVNGDAIYGTQRRSKNKPENRPIAFTRKDGNLYVILKEWIDEPIVLTHVKHAGKVELLG